MPFSVIQIINIAKISQYLAAADAAKGSLFGERKIPETAKILYMERKAVEWLYNLDPTNSSLTGTANYLYSLCRGYNLEAQNILNIGGGGSISPITPSGGLPEPYDFEVGVATSPTAPLANGDSSVTLSSFIGYNVEFIRNNIPQNTTNVGNSYYGWNRVTGLFTVSPAVVTGELLRIVPIG